jgi:hypothetical protein
MLENKPFITFKKERDLGAIITDVFKFIRYNWKEYFGTLIKIIGPVLILAIITIIGLLFSYGDMFQNLQNQSADNPFAVFSSILPWYGAMLLAIVVLYTLMSMTTLYFIKYYIENNGESSFEYVKDNVMNNIWKFLGLGVLITFSLIIGYLFCLFPFIYLLVVLSLAAPIMVFENRGVTDSYGYSFSLIKGQWWNTFGVVIVIGLLISVLGSVFSVPSLIYYFVKIATGISEDDPTKIFEVFKDPIYLALNVLSYTFQFILYSVTMISGVLIYFDLNEQKNQTGTIEKIENLGA